VLLGLELLPGDGPAVGLEVFRQKLLLLRHAVGPADAGAEVAELLQVRHGAVAVERDLLQVGGLAAGLAELVLPGGLVRVERRRLVPLFIGLTVLPRLPDEQHDRRSEQDRRREGLNEPRH
jgi:hypothetical protein